MWGERLLEVLLPAHETEVLGPRIEVSKLRGVSGFDAADVGAALENAERQAILNVTDRGLGFTHELVARAVYNDISPLRRQVMHRRIAELSVLPHFFVALVEK